MPRGHLGPTLHYVITINDWNNDVSLNNIVITLDKLQRDYELSSQQIAMLISNKRIEMFPPVNGCTSLKLSRCVCSRPASHAKHKARNENDEQRKLDELMRYLNKHQ